MALSAIVVSIDVAKRHYLPRRYISAKSGGGPVVKVAFCVSML